MLIYKNDFLQYSLAVTVTIAVTFTAVAVVAGVTLYTHNKSLCAIWAFDTQSWVFEMDVSIG